MFSKLAIVCVAALAVVAQAGHQGHHKRHTHGLTNATLTHNPFDYKPSGYPGEAGIRSGAAPYPTVPGGSSLLSTGASGLVGTGAVTTYTTTKIVETLTTYCPGPTTLTQNGKPYTVTKVITHWPYNSSFALMSVGNNSYDLRMPVHVHLYNYWFPYSDSVWRHRPDLCRRDRFFDLYSSDHNSQYIV